MGDLSTHAILYNGYWYLVMDDDGLWVDVKNHGDPVCHAGEEHRKISLSNRTPA